MTSPAYSAEQAFSRCETLLKIIDKAKSRAISGTSNEYAISLGIIEQGDKYEDAKKKIDNMFAQLEGLVAHLAILDLTASFEIAFRERLKNAVGEARKAIKNNYKLSTLSKVRESLVQEVDSFKGIGGVEALLGPQLDGELLKKLKIIRANRNQFAHGTNVEVLPTIDSVDVLDALREIGDLL